MFCASVLSLTACNGDPDVLFQILFGKETAAVILADRPVTVSAKPQTFTLAKPEDVIGKISSLCMVLAHDVKGADSEAVADRLLRGARFEATVETADKQHFRLTSLSKSWRMFGRLQGRDEVAACVVTNCGVAIPIGVKVSSITVTASSDVPVEGIYWESTKAFDQIVPPAGKTDDKKAAAGDAPHVPGHCASGGGR